VVFIQLAEHCKQATTETLTTETIFVIVRLTISILIVVGTCYGPCAKRRSRGLASPRLSRVMSRQSRARRSRMSACRGKAALRP